MHLAAEESIQMITPPFPAKLLSNRLDPQAFRSRFHQIVALCFSAGQRYSTLGATPGLQRARAHGDSTAPRGLAGSPLQPAQSESV